MFGDKIGLQFLGEGERATEKFIKIFKYPVHTELARETVLSRLA
jgi:hypothetical protein